MLSEEEESGVSGKQRTGTVTSSDTRMAITQPTPLRVLHRRPLIE